MPVPPIPPCSPSDPAGHVRPRLGLPELLLAWSFSRARSRRWCKRFDFWRYFGWRGLGLPQSETARRDARRAAALRHLTTVPLLLGTVVHTAGRLLFEAIRDGTARPDVDELLRGALFTMNHVRLSSRPPLVERFWQMPAIYPALREIVLRGGLRAHEVIAAREKLRRCLEHLCSAPLLEDLESAPEGHILVNAAGPVAFAPAEGITAWAALDLGYLHVNAETCRGLATAPTWCITDLKTSAKPAPDDERLQLGAYGLWFEASGLARTRGQYLGRIVRLADGTDTWYTIGDRELRAARRHIEADTDALRGLMIDPQRGLPRPIGEWALAADVGRCRGCVFHPLCADELRRGRDFRSGARDGSTSESGENRSESPHLLPLSANKRVPETLLRAESPEVIPMTCRDRDRTPPGS